MLARAEGKAFVPSIANQEAVGVESRCDQHGARPFQEVRPARHDCNQGLSLRRHPGRKRFGHGPPMHSIPCGSLARTRSTLLGMARGIALSSSSGEVHALKSDATTGKATACRISAVTMVANSASGSISRK